MCFENGQFELAMSVNEDSPCKAVRVSEPKTWLHIESDGERFTYFRFDIYRSGIGLGCWLIVIFVICELPEWLIVDDDLAPEKI